MKNHILTIKRIVRGRRTIDGAGVSLVRVFARDDTADFDPFLMLDAFDSEDPNDYIKGFPWHPHRGIETITYLIHGNVEHGDSLGNKGAILDGECQWMTAGSGIVHQEMPQPVPRLLGTQIWLNMPAKHKMATPKYNDITMENVPVVEESGAVIRLIAGTYQGTQGAFSGDYVHILYMDITLAPNAAWSLPTDADHNLFVYIVSGEGRFGSPDADTVSSKNAVLFEKGDEFKLFGGDDGIRLLLLAGKPLREPVAWGGPIVMNTKEELDLAFRELKENTFIKHSAEY